MPWQASDARRFTHAARTEAEQHQWAEVANRSLAEYLEKGEPHAKAAGIAVRIANASLDKKESEE